MIMKHDNVIEAKILIQEHPRILGSQAALQNENLLSNKSCSF